jgi:predicted 3-demethylubiquinone-9 3-methyltransferase (glyoxalase superfamily)
MTVRRITPFLWYDGQAEEAAKFYCSIFKKSKITESSPMSVTFELDGQTFYALNGGPHYKFTPAVSFFVSCADQKEVDYYWDRLLAGGKPSRCGWLEDKFGLSWQVIPEALTQCISGPDREGAKRAIQAMLGMVKLNVKELEDAYRGNGSSKVSSRKAAPKKVVGKKKPASKSKKKSASKRKAARR